MDANKEKYKRIFNRFLKEQKIYTIFYDNLKNHSKKSWCQHVNFEDLYDYAFFYRKSVYNLELIRLAFPWDNSKIGFQKYYTNDPYHFWEAKNHLLIKLNKELKLIKKCS